MKISVRRLSIIIAIGAVLVLTSPAAHSTPPNGTSDGMVWLKGGEFLMGSDTFADAKPWHRVYVDGFWVDTTEVTNTEFS